MLTILALAFSLSADAFAVALSQGAKYPKLSLYDKLAMATCMGGAEALAPLLGWVLGQSMRGMIEASDHWVAFCLLSALGLRMVYHAMHLPREHVSHMRPTLTTMLTTAMATSADAAVAGLSISFIRAPVVEVVLTIGFISGLMVMLGLQLGKRANGWGVWAEVAGGYGLIILGSHILASHVLG